MRQAPGAGPPRNAPVAPDLPERAGSVGPMSQVNDFNQGIIDEFRANKGAVGAFAGAPMVLLTTTGAKSGQKRVNPLATLPEGDVLYVFASKAGAPTNPDWYHNVVAHPEVEVEFGEERFDAIATPVTGPERDRIWEEQKIKMPGFADYEKSTDRIIPVVELRRVETGT
jgi:deazaflavin-dependent oxidoreductase (nitroreductase family)